MVDINLILNEDEKILWQGKPEFLPYILNSIYFTPIALFLVVWGTFFFGVFLAVLLIIPILGAILYILLMLGFYATVLLGPIIYFLASYPYEKYFLTDKRVLIKSGFLGITEKNRLIDFDKLQNVELQSGIIDSIFGTKSIHLFTAGTFMRGEYGVIGKPYVIKNIKEGEKVFKGLKQVSFDVKAELEFPSKYRPKTTKGYKTKYDSNALNKILK